MEVNYQNTKYVKFFSLQCEAGKVLNIIEAFYGKDKCPNKQADANELGTVSDR